MTTELTLAMADDAAAWATEHPHEVAAMVAIRAAEDRARSGYRPQEQFPGQRELIRMRMRQAHSRPWTAEDERQRTAALQRLGLIDMTAAELDAAAITLDDAE